jgi:type VI secretion system protein
MALTLEITSFQSQTLGPDSRKVFTEMGGTIGRAQGNDWVLPDPERFISGSHAAIFYQDGVYYLRDTSTNGVFVNGATEPVGTGNSVPLNNGDRLVIGEYQIDVHIDAGVPAPDVSAGWAPPPQEESELVITSPTGRPDMPETLDPLAFTSPPPAESGAAEPFAEAGAEPDHVDSLMGSFQAPAAHEEKIPDDWDMTDYSSGAAPAKGPPQAPVPQPKATARPAPAAAPAQPYPPEPPPQPAAPQPPVTPQPPPVAPPAAGAVSSDLLAAFLRGAGLDPSSVVPGDSVEVMENYGRLFRVVVEGMMEVLMARASLKSEFRMPLTTIRPVENNPLKFSPNIDEAMRNLFVNPGAGYLSPAEAIHEGFEDIKCHQMAMIAGMQAAFKDMMLRFSPEGFQERDKGAVRAALMSVSKKSRFWDAYCEFYQEVTRDADASFQRLFGEEFARAYEEQIQRLSAMRRL